MKGEGGDLGLFQELGHGEVHFFVRGVEVVAGLVRGLAALVRPAAAARGREEALETCREQRHFQRFGVVGFGRAAQRLPEVL